MHMQTKEKQGMLKVACLTCRPSPHFDDFDACPMSRIDDSDSLDKGLFGRHGRGPHLGVVEHGVVAAAVVVLAGDDHVVGPLVVIVLLFAGGVEGVGRDDGAAGAAGG